MYNNDVIMRDDDGDYLLQGLIPNIGGGRCVVGPFTTIIYQISKHNYIKYIYNYYSTSPTST